MAAARRGGRERGKSDSIDAIAVARAALCEGLTKLPAAELEGPELDLRLLVDHRERLARQRVALNNTLQPLDIGAAKAEAPVRIARRGAISARYATCLQHLTAGASRMKVWLRVQLS